MGRQLATRCFIYMYYVSEQSRPGATVLVRLTGSVRVVSWAVDRAEANGRCGRERPTMQERIRVVKGDITGLAVDAIANAANTSLLGGGGVDGAIHRAAGPELLAECRILHGCDTGDAKITSGYRLPAKHVIHTVGPVYHGGRRGEPEKLRSCYRRSLEVAVENNVRAIAFPAISCGVYGYPLREACRIAVDEVMTFLDEHPEIEQVLFVGFSQDVVDAYAHALWKGRRVR